MLVDLHVHSSFSFGCPLDPEQAVARAEAVGLDGVCFTDVGAFRGLETYEKLAQTSKIAVFAGLEVATDHGRYLAFFAEPRAHLDLRFGPDLPSARRVVEQVRDRGGVVVAAHPYDRSVERPAGDFVFTLRGLSAVEGYAGTRKSNVNELAIEAADHLSLPCVGGSAAEKEYEEIGTAATLFKEPVRNEAELVEAIRGGAVWAVAIGTPPRFQGDQAVRGYREDRHPRGDRPERRDRGGRGGPRRRGGGRSGGRR